MDGLLSALASLRSLSCLCLRLKAFDEYDSTMETSMDLSILAASKSLKDLELESHQGYGTTLSHAHRDQIRLSLGHLQRFAVVRPDSDELARFLQPPVTAQWQDIGSVYADERTGELLLRLPTLTKLELLYARVTAHVNFLPQLTRLTSLDFECYSATRGCEQPWSVPTDALFVSLVLCTGITELRLCCGFESAQWPALFAKLTIKKLTIHRSEMVTLQCFETGPITQSLKELVIHDCSFPLSEVSHLYALRRLRTLRLNECFLWRLAASTIDSLSPPTPILPALTTLFHRGPGEHQSDSIERSGPSFEWMQQRLTQ